jgi:hypothetical protein|tara:strand:- start:260 stop:553 length:294 start_codon:yes stop_codon:yes gene_type:complete
MNKHQYIIKNHEISIKTEDGHLIRWVVHKGHPVDVGLKARLFSGYRDFDVYATNVDTYLDTTWGDTWMHLGYVSELSINNYFKNSDLYPLGGWDYRN